MYKKMSNRIVSNSTFTVNNSLEQVVEVANTSLAVTNAGLTSLASAISGSEVQVDIVSAPTLNVSDSAAQSSLATLASAVSGSEVQVDIVSSSGTISVSDSSGNTSLATIAGAVAGTEMQVDLVSAPTLNVDLDSVAGSALALGSTGSANCVPVVIASDQSAISVSTSNANNSGSSGNLVNAASKSSGDFSSEVDTRAARNITITGTTSDGSQNEIEIHTAHSSGGTKFKVNFGIYPDSSGNFFQRLENVALNYLSLKFTNSSAATVTATALFN